jgi:hypothetical protein
LDIDHLLQSFFTVDADGDIAFVIQRIKPEIWLEVFTAGAIAG